MIYVKDATKIYFTKEIMQLKNTSYGTLTDYKLASRLKSYVSISKVMYTFVKPYTALN